ncbi:hypothetical protein [Cylindrospermum sp. FACHB-282]|uniref:hypothetical protein n=1 Tax=Cylindrospermum sp. FACHB-282 TaxID=2692794 RepID=UPI0018EF4962|nr:hypothetical protein [Cylindrospermum sp. FACHB-282]
MVIIEEVTKELDDETIDLTVLEEKVAAEYFGDGAGNWPRFFTTYRWVLGEGGEKHLTHISYSG